MGVPISELPIAKAEAAAAALTAQNPPGIKHNADGTTEELKTEIDTTDLDEEAEEEKSESAGAEGNTIAGEEKEQKLQTEAFVSSLLMMTDGPTKLLIEDISD